MFYDPGTKLDYPWGAKYVKDNPCIRFVAIDSKKRGLGMNKSGILVMK